MEAVKSFLEEKSCTIEIRVIDLSSTALPFTPVEFVIKMPSNLYQYMGESVDEELRSA